jgi:hypothetical protein
MRQADLFGEAGLQPKREVVAQQKREQERELGRVTFALKDHVLLFARRRWSSRGGAPAFFYGCDLEAFVKKQTGAAPESPGRILRVLRQEGQLNYRIVSRNQSLYELLSVTE